MFQKIFIDIIRRRHYWRYASFSEISELYISRVLRVIGANLGAGFAFVFLLQMGYELFYVVWALIGYLLFRLIMLPFVALLIARYGPKHSIFISNLLYVPAMISLGLVPVMGLFSLLGWGVFMGLSVTIYQMAYYVDFSKIKSVEHSGKELGYMNILEKAAIAVTPIIGGLVALFFGPSILMWTSAVVIMLAAIPLMSSSEPTRTHQKIVWRDFNLRMALSSYRAQYAIGFDTTSTSSIWIFFLTLVLFKTSGNAIYLNLGLLASVTFIVAILISYFFGKMIDSNGGRYLLKFSVIINSVVYLLRPFTGSAIGAAGINGANELATTGFTMAHNRGMFDLADTSGHRIIYLLGIEIVQIFGALTAAIGFLVLITFLPLETSFDVFFVIGAFVVLLIGTSNFAIYRK